MYINFNNVQTSRARAYTHIKKHDKTQQNYRECFRVTVFFLFP